MPDLPVAFEKRLLSAGRNGKLKKEQQANEPDEPLMERKVDCTGGIFAVVQGSDVQSRLQANHVVIVQLTCFALFRF